MIAGLDINTKLVAWAILSGTKIHQIGQAEIGHDGADQFEVSRVAADYIRDYFAGAPVLAAVEVLDFPSRSTPSIKNYRHARWLEGRVLDALSVSDDNVIEISASSESKRDRRRRIEIKYVDQIDRKLSQDEIDALAVADAARTDIIKRTMLKGVS